MTQCFPNQRGAVTLIGALFIIVTLALMLATLQRMAGSDILDTALQNDSVEALFIVESGIEYASFLYAKGRGCTGLGNISANAGRGNFTIAAAFEAGGYCRVRVEGTVGSTGTAQARRTVDADLHLANSGDKSNIGAVTLVRWQEIIGN